MDRVREASSPSSRIHGRNMSDDRRRVAMPRRLTKGPLDAGSDPLASPQPNADIVTSRTTTPLSSGEHVPSSNSLQAEPVKDFSFLLRPEIFHPLSQLDTPLPFRSTVQQPSPDTPLDDLLTGGHFRAAAIAAANQLTSVVDSSDYKQILSLFYIRLVCLTLINATMLASQEIKALEDLNSSFYHDPLTNEHLAPWELRVLAVRLQGIGFGDWRRGIMGYYDLAREARATLVKTEGNDKAMWNERLRDLGVRVANTLIEMGDLEAAARHLETLENGGESDKDKVRFWLALLYLRIGDLHSSRTCFKPWDGGEENEKTIILQALYYMSDGKYSEAVSEFRKARNGKTKNEMIEQNMAICLLYTGDIPEARSILEALIDDGYSFPALTFNLSTIYELTSERSRTLKEQLAERVAQQPENGSAWEKSNANFKL